MPLFQFEAVTYSGKTKQGTIEGESIHVVKQMLLNKELVPISIKSIDIKRKSSGFFQFFSNSKPISPSDLSILSKQLAVLVRAGISIEESIGIIVENGDIKSHTHKILESLLSDIRSGTSFSQAIANHPESFGTFFQGVISAAEQSGQMGNVLTKLAIFLEKRESLKQKALSAMLYPMILIVVSMMVIVFLMTYVVPQIVQVFESTKQKLPLITQIVMAFSNFLTNWGLIVVIGILLAALIFNLLLKKPSFKYQFDQFCLKIPILGKLILQFETARFSGTMALLVGANIPILSALFYAKNTLSNMVLRKTIEETEDRLREGASFAKAIAHQGIFSPILVHLIRSGEASGKLAEMLQYGAENAELEAENKTKMFTNLLEPVLILLMGFFVLGIVMAVMEPILNMNNGIR
jgi:general secretion pathway protein F